VAEYLAAEHPGVRWAMAGRSLDKLTAVRDEIGAPADTPLIVADSSDPASLQALAERTDAMITTVGPYQKYGEPLVRACVSAGTDYVDLCGEPAWMRDMIDRYDGEAKKTGARIVLSCGFDSIPFDMGVFFLQEEAIRRAGAPIARVKGRVRKMKGTFSGGTAASFFETMKRAGEEPRILDWLKDPFSLAGGFSGPKQPSGSKPIYEEDLGSWSAPFIMATINVKNVHRSNALLGHRYGEDFVYDEDMFLTGPGEDGETLANHVANDKSMAENPPKPGEGPSKEERETGYYEVMFTGETVEGERLTAVVAGDKDPGYGLTWKMITEAALTLRETPRETTSGGVYTPAPALGQPLIDRLTRHAGLTFKIA